MDSEFVVCDLDTFRESYLPFNPSEEDIQSGLRTLHDRGRASFDAQNNLWGKNFTQPSHHNGTETKIFSSLQGIFDALTGCRLGEANAARRCNFVFCSHPDRPLSADTPEYNHRIDGSFIRLGLRSPEDVCTTPGPISMADVGVSVKFKTNKLDKDVYDNRKKILSASNHIINDDIRRMFTFGITVEGDEMSVWYFSRSHSVKSTPFNFIQNLKDLTAVCLSFMFSSDEEMGYDPCVTQSKDDYIYHFEGKDRYFRTRRLIAEYRSLCITGRMTRIWEAVEVNREQTREIRKPVVLKDVWLDAVAQTEKQIQDEIFHDIQASSESVLDPHGQLEEFPAMRARLGQVLAKGRYKEYFLRIECDYQGKITKPLAPSASPKRGLFDTPLSTPPPTSQCPFNPTRAPPQMYHTPRRQYRVVYNEVCKAMHDLDSLQAITRATVDCLTALQLLYCAGWVHRDISSGNILAYEVEGTVRGKLADLEYAKKFASTPRCSDPRTGTPFFMPFEIQRQQYISPPSRKSIPLAIFSEDPTPSTPARPPVRFNFQHDLESLWWVLLWVVTRGLDHAPSRKFADKVFQHQSEASAERRSVIMDETYLLDELEKCLHPSVQKYGASLDQCLMQLRASYEQREQAGNLENPASYTPIHGTMDRFLKFWKSTVDKNDDVRIDLQPKRAPSTGGSANPPHQTKREPPEDDNGEPSQGNRSLKRIRRLSIS
ncbi:hypothetical protein BD779DRAFT_509185 [Infundibulicybe gibba]|nr:hypothetical protein BD779DRAFT_509185 [Infundibulicybe gibba]